MVYCSEPYENLKESQRQLGANEMRSMLKQTQSEAGDNQRNELKQLSV